MKLRVLSLVFVLVIGIFSTSGQNTAKLHKGIEEYFDSLIYYPTDTITSRIDRLITALPDKKEQAKVAGAAFDYFYGSPVMGMEAVSLHIADNWFLNGKLEWANPESWHLLYTFAEFNRSSMIGCDAPELILESIDGYMMNILKGDCQWKILYFYDDKCATCKEETPQLARFAKEYSGPRVTIFAVYTQDNREEWEEYVKLIFGDIANPYVTILHLWDPEVSSSYHMKYGVLTTPSMFLIDRFNIITGRKLNCEALCRLLDVKLNESNEFRKLFNNIFSSMEPVDKDVIDQVAETFFRRTESDSTLYRETFHELYSFLKNTPGAAFQQGALDIGHNYILEKKEYWPMEYLNNISRDIRLSSTNLPGEKASDLFLTDSKGRERRLLKGCSRYTILWFYLISCEECHKEALALAEKEKYLRKKGVKVKSVYVGGDEESWRDFQKRNPKKWVYLWNKTGESGLDSLYDVRTVPQIYLLDRKKRVIGRELGAEHLFELLDTL
jgi:peroxiredoxin